MKSSIPELKLKEIDVPVINLPFVRNPTTCFFAEQNILRRALANENDKLMRPLIENDFKSSLISTKADVLTPSNPASHFIIREVTSIPSKFVIPPKNVFYGDETSGVFKTSL